MASVRAVWLGLAALAFALCLAVGVPFWFGVAGFVFAAIPAIAGMFVRNFVKETSSDEIEITLWVAFATLGAMVTGGPASPLAAGFAVAFLLAASTGQLKLVIESVVFSLLGYVAALLVSLAGNVIDSTVGEKLGAVYGLAAVALIARLVWLATVSTGNTSRANAAAGNSATAASGPEPEFDLVQKLRQMEERLARSAAAAMEAREQAATAETALAARTRFFAQTSHELRQPLGPIITFANMIAGEIRGPIDAKYRDYAVTIEAAGREMSLIVDDVLDLSKIEAGHRIDPQDASLNDVAAEAIHFMAFEAARKSIELAFDDDGEDVEAFIDVRAVRQIALNLISNALKFTPEGGVVTVKVFDAKGFSWLAVSDTGVGMSVEELKRMSRAFEQGEAGRKEKGTGLGLSVVRAFAQLHGGGLEIDSREGGGSTVAVFFPAKNSTA